MWGRAWLHPWPWRRPRSPSPRRVPPCEGIGGQHRLGGLFACSVLSAARGNHRGDCRLYLGQGERDADEAVWQMRISLCRAPTSCAANWHRRSAATTPAAPVAALALPDVRTTPAARPAVADRWALLTRTGAAAARLAVKTAAAAIGLPSSLPMKARSATPSALIPTAPRLRRTPPGRLPTSPTPFGDRPPDHGHIPAIGNPSTPSGRARGWRTGSPGLLHL